MIKRGISSRSWFLLKTFKSSRDREILKEPFFLGLDLIFKKGYHENVAISLAFQDIQQKVIWKTNLFYHFATNFFFQFQKVQIEYSKKYIGVMRTS